jgi:hypothetical protein
MDSVPDGANGQVPTGRNTGHPSNVSAHKTQGKKSKLNLKIAAMAAGLLVLIALAFGGWSFYQSTPGAHIDTSKYQSVFFTNGQVYFGKLHKLGGGYFSLTDIFYIQSKTPTTTNDSANPQNAGTQSTADLQLIKLGDEVHGPSDEMVIRKEQILFFENLKKDGKVTQSITKYHGQQN